MSIRYQIFGLPKTIDDMTDFAKKRGDKAVEVSVERREHSEGDDIAWKLNIADVYISSRHLTKRQIAHFTGYLFNRSEMEQQVENYISYVKQRTDSIGLDIHIEGIDINKLKPYDSSLRPQPLLPQFKELFAELK